MSKNQRSKYPPGLEPIDFKQIGKIILSLSLIALIIEAGIYITGFMTIPSILLFFSFAFFMVGLYLVIFVPDRQ